MSERERDTESGRLGGGEVWSGVARCRVWGVELLMAGRQPTNLVLSTAIHHHSVVPFFPSDSSALYLHLSAP